MAKLVQYIPRETTIHRLDPRVKLAVIPVVLILSFVLAHPLALLGLVLLLYAAWAWVRAPLDYVRGLLVMTLFLMLFITIIQGLFWQGADGVAVLKVGSVGLYRAGLLRGVAMGLRLAAIISVMPLVTMTTPMADLMLALVSFGIPWQIAYIVLTAFRFVPLLTGQADTVLNAQKLRGLNIEKANIVRRIMAYAPLAVPVILGAFRSSEQLEMVLECRGFGTNLDQRSSLYEIKWKQSDTIAIALLLLALAAAITARILGIDQPLA